LLLKNLKKVEFRVRRTLVKVVSSQNALNAYKVFEIG
jgi:hypothetical protein